MFSSRVELETEIEQLERILKRANLERRSIQVLQAGQIAQAILPILTPARQDEQFSSIQDIQKEIVRLTVQLEHNKLSVEDRMELVSKLEERNEVLARKGGAPYTRIRQQNNEEHCLPTDAVEGTATTKTTLPPTINEFYKALIERINNNSNEEQDNDALDFKLLDLAFLVSNVHQMKIYYTLIQMLYRRHHIRMHDWQRYTRKALRQTATVLSLQVHDNATDGKESSSCQDMLHVLWNVILDKCRRDGAIGPTWGSGLLDKETLIQVKSEPLNTKSRNDKSMIDDCTCTCSEVDIRKEVSHLEFRVGQILYHEEQSEHQSRGPSAGEGGLDSMAVNDQKHLNNVLLKCSKRLGWSLNQLYSVSTQDNDDGDNHDCDQDVTTWAMCCVLNALAFGTETTGPIKEHSFLFNIVDFGDMDHIAEVVNQSDQPPLKSAYEAGSEIVDRVATAAVINGNSMNKTASSRTQNVALIMGQLTNAASRLANTNDTFGDRQNESTIHATNHEAIQALALIVTVKVIGLAHESTTSPSPPSPTESTDFVSTEPANGTSAMKSAINHHGSPRSLEAAQQNRLSCSQLYATEDMCTQSGGELKSLDTQTIPSRLHRLEATVGVMYRLKSLERYYGLCTNDNPERSRNNGERSSPLVNRIENLEQLLHYPSQIAHDTDT